MKTTVVYYSKTGNTKIIAENIARALECDSIAINLMKSGRKTKQEIEEEKQLFKKAINPELNRIKKATFSLPWIAGLLYKYEIEIDK